MDWNDAFFWLLLGLTGNALFFSRFLVQWIASERAGRSHVPVAFWWLSIAGSLVLLIYAIHRRDPVFTLAFLPNCVVYVRNLMLIRKERAAAALAASRREHDDHERDEGEWRPEPRIVREAVAARPVDHGVGLISDRR
jgi:lipid-A-disaccharide synthase-like uncharacterized protein